MTSVLHWLVKNCAFKETHEDCDKTQAGLLKSDLDKAAEPRLSAIRTEISRNQAACKRLKEGCDVAQQTNGLPDHAYITQHASLIQKMEQLADREPGPSLSIPRNPHPVKYLKKTDTAVTLGTVKTVRHLELVQEIEGFEDAYRVDGVDYPSWLACHIRLGC